MSDTNTRVPCTEPGCRSELLWPPDALGVGRSYVLDHRHVDHLKATYRCPIHRNHTPDEAR